MIESLTAVTHVFLMLLKPERQPLREVPPKVECAAWADEAA